MKKKAQSIDKDGINEIAFLPIKAVLEKQSDFILEIQSMGAEKAIKLAFDAIKLYLSINDANSYSAAESFGRIAINDEKTIREISSLLSRLASGKP